VKDLRQVHDYWIAGPQLPGRSDGVQLEDSQSFDKFAGCVNSFGDLELPHSRAAEPITAQNNRPTLEGEDMSKVRAHV
jgi:hypothetical protein